MKKTLAISAIFISVLFSQSVFASAPYAKLAKVKGIVLINNGESFVRAKPGIRLKKGDQILALENASAIIRQNNNCETKIVENTLVKIPGIKQCLKKTAEIKQMGPMFAAALGLMEPAEKVEEVVETTEQPVSSSPEPSQGGALGAFIDAEPEVEAESIVASTPEETFLEKWGTTIAVPATLTGAVIFSTLVGGGGSSDDDSGQPLSEQ